MRDAGGRIVGKPSPGVDAGPWTCPEKTSNEILMPGTTTSSPRPRNHLFLCGVGRSGTTILRRSLGLHSAMYYEGKENNLVQDILAVARDNCTLPSRKFAMNVDQKTYDDAFRQLIQQLVWPGPQGHEKPIWMAAINPVAEQMDYLCQVFPNARILVLVRNGIEVVASRMNHRSFGKLDFESHCQTWIRTRGIIHWGQRHPGRFRIMRHEWFYDERALESALEHIFEWLEIPAESQVLRNFAQSLPHPTGRPVTTAGESVIKSHRAFFESKSRAWCEWTPGQRQTFHRICAPFMQELGYEMPHGT